MLLESEKIAIRRHLNIGFAGLPGLSQTTGLRAVTRAGELELYMSAMSPGEETVLIGAPFGETLIFGPRFAGDTYTYTFNAGTPVTYTVSTMDTLAAWPQQTIASNIATTINTASTGVIAAAQYPPARSAPVPSFGGYPQAAEMYFQAVNRQPFAMTVTGPGIQIAATGTSVPFPQLSVDPGTGVPQIIAGVLPICNYLESSFLGTDARLAFNLAGATTTGQVVFNRGELRQRNWLYVRQVRQMSVLLGYTLGSSVAHGLY